MRHLLFTAILFCSGTLFAENTQPRQLKYLAPSTGTPPSEYYFTKLLSAALAKVENQYALIPIASNMQQKRLMTSLLQSQFDVLWTMTSSDRESQAKPIRIPLTMGLFGYRQLIVKRDNKALFDNMQSIEQLKSQLCAQGRYWPDLEILQGNNFRVAAADGIPEIYRLINQGLTDYTARSVLEVDQELLRFKNLNVNAVNQFLIYYPTAMYFFVRNDDDVLYQDLLNGLEQMVKSGELFDLLSSHPKYNRAVEWLVTSPPQIWRVNNPLLPANTPIQTNEYWLAGQIN
jgi:hypothetical protein